MTIKELVDQDKIPKVLDIPDHITKVVVHDGQFHADDVFCVALLKECYDENITVRRIPRNADIEKYGYDTLICDIGMKYDGENYFDHHQIDPRSVSSKELRAAVGLLWDRFGSTIYHKTTSMIRDIDRHDCDSRRFRSQLCVSIAAFNPDWNATDKERDMHFDLAVNVARQLIRSTIVSDTYTMRALREVSENNYIENDVMFLDTKAPYDSFIDIYDCKVVARKCGNRYKLKAVNGYSFNPSWSGNPPFHGMSMSNWIIDCGSKETAIKIAAMLK